MKTYLSSDIGRQLSLMTLISLISMLLLFYLFFNAFSNGYYTEKRAESQHMTSVASSIVNSFHQLSLNGDLTSEEAVSLALGALQEAKYSEDGYFWINNSAGQMVMHPVKPELNHQNMLYFQDPNGQFIFAQFIKAALSGGGWIDYSWMKPSSDDEVVPKISYVTYFEPWDWIIGTGVYLDDLQAQRNDIFFQSARLIFIVFLLLGLASGLLTKHSLGVIKEVAIKDPLTRLYTRRFLNETEGSLIRRDERDRNGYLYVMFLDIDYFKRINDSYGHRCGDTVLRAIGKALQQHTRPEDLCIRYGGEEFLIVSQADSDALILALAERLRRQIHHLQFREQIELTVSIGVARRQAGEPFTAVLNRSDMNLYQAKQNGRDQVVM